MNINDINAELQRLESLKKDLANKELPKSPIRRMEVTMVWKGPTFNLLNRCLNKEELDSHDKECLALYGRCHGNYYNNRSETWQYLMQYCIVQDPVTMEWHLIFLGGGTIITKRDNGWMSYSVKITEGERESLLSGMFPPNLLSENELVSYSVILAPSDLALANR